ncbi:MAG TPA: class I SAM-dependent rRNA methyltransferase [Chryseolinea sp.]|nr:class I SAM-dependent rRNA methyltransferase [Chryseolinea sp.]
MQRTIILKKGKEYSIERFHPWIFSGAIQDTVGDLTDGCWVEVLTFKKKLLGYGHYQKGSISVRMLSFMVKPAHDFWTSKITQALRLRELAVQPSDSTNAFRLVHGEGDGLPGLIIDYYNGIAVMQAHSVGMHLDRINISDALQAILKEDLKAVFYKSQTTLPGKSLEGFKDEYLFGMSAVPHLIHENQTKFFVDWEEGQKTGFFLDQRENRKLLSSYANGKNVLNTFCYSGGFSVYALAAKAALVHSVDSSEKAINLTRKNIELNGFNSSDNPSFAEDVFEFMKDKHDQYDVIVLDPPAFAKHRDARHQAVKGYQRLNAEAMKMIRPAGIIFTFSCSQVVDKKLFYDTVVSAGIQAGRQIKVLHHLSQAADHPVSLFHPEGEYLKGLVLYVE